MERHWEPYLRKEKGRRAPRFYVTINRFGDITLNRHTFEEIGSPAAVVLLIDRLEGTIGLKHARPQDPNAFRMRPAGKCGNQRVRAARFCSDLKINADPTIRFVEPTIEGGVLILDLAATVTVKRNKTAANLPG